MIELKDVRKTYRKGGHEIRALDGVSLRIAQGEFVAIVGPSGSGKSTLMHIIGLLDRPDAGTYTLEGRPVDGLGADELARLRNEKIGFVFQAFHLLPRTTARENVELPLIYSARVDVGGLVDRALAAVGLADRAGHEPGELSGGQQQRVAVARALVNEPDVILADEPTGNLDSRSGLELLGVFQALHREGRTIVLITHDIELAALAGRIVRLGDGRIVADDPVAQPLDARALLAEAREPVSPV
ncbi:MAG: ABC transporter ATP-binding protein [Gemmatimonadetes bacterium]|nr:ABC transporter ATP-binding protein [Gemmatimonadota bacterium]